MKTKITCYKGEYVDIGHWFIGVYDIFENRAMLHIGCKHSDTVVTVNDGEAYRDPYGETILMTAIGYDPDGTAHCTFGFLTPDGVTPVRSEQGPHLQ